MATVYYTKENIAERMADVDCFQYEIMFRKPDDYVTLDNLTFTDLTLDDLPNEFPGYCMHISQSWADILFYKNKIGEPGFEARPEETFYLITIDKNWYEKYQLTQPPSKGSTTTPPTD